MPNGITSIEEQAFYKCTKLVNINIPNNVRNIESIAFYGCDGLTNVTIPNSVTYLGDSAFARCENLKDITIKGSTTLDNMAFYACHNLINVHMDDGTINIGQWAFAWCSNLVSITIPKNVTNIGSSAFSFCSKLTNINVDEANENFCTLNGSLYDKNMSKLIQYTSGKQDKIFEIPESVISIDNYAIAGSSLTSVVISDNVKYIAKGAFYNCGSLATVYYGGTEDEWNNISIGDNNDDLKNAEIIFAGKTRTFHFVTNCEISLPDITGARIETAPVVTSEGRTFVGWYDNEALNGEPVTFPYSGESDTLYAAWKNNPFTKTVCVTASRGEKIFITTPNYMPETAQIMLACYKGGELVDVIIEDNNNEMIYFVVGAEFDSAKIMTWQSIESMIPLCTFEPVDM